MADYRLFAGAALFVLVFAGLQGGMFSTLFDDVDTVSPEPYHCPVEDDGNIVISSVQQDCDGVGSGGRLPWDSVSVDDDTGFWIGVESINDGSRESVAPASKYLIEQGYVTNEDEEYRNIRMDSDIEWSSEIKNSLESGTKCEADIRVLSDSQGVNYRYGEDGENLKNYDTDRYADESDWYSIYELFPEKVTVKAEEVRISEYQMACKFDFEELMNRGAEHTPFYSWSNDRWTGAKPMIYGDDRDEGETSLRVDFGFDDDGDGVRNENDDFPDDPRLTDRRDSDGDGVLDEVDAAPNEAGSKVDGSPTFLESVVHDIGVSGWLQPDFVPRF